MKTNTASSARADDQQALIESIGTLVRADESHDDERVDVIARAGGLGHADLIPDNWNVDGSLADRSATWSTDEERETHSDLATALRDVLAEQVDGYYYLVDFDDDTAYYAGEGCMYAAPYSVESDGPVTIGEGQRVRPVTSYVPAIRSETSAPNKRLGTRTLERRRERASALSELQRKRPDRRPLASSLELRDNDDEGPYVLRSYASLFDEPYMVGSGEMRYEETVERSAFKRTLAAGPDVVFRAEHSGPPLARTSAQSLRLGTDEKGLWYEADLQRDDPDVLSLIPKIRRGDLRESSFAFRCIDDKWSEDFSKRSLRACELDRGDVSIVTFGASAGTGRYMQLRHEEELAALRSLGFEAFLQAFVEWRDYTLLTLEKRAGKVLSSTSLDTLLRVLDLVSGADDGVDEAQVLLADLMGVPNPDEDAPGEQDDDDDDGDEGERASEDAAPVEPVDDIKSDKRSVEIPPSRLSEFEAELRTIGGR